jgi:hypothetical protein
MERLRTAFEVAAGSDAVTVYKRRVDHEMEHRPGALEKVGRGGMRGLKRSLKRAERSPADFVHGLLGANAWAHLGSGYSEAGEVGYLVPVAGGWTFPDPFELADQLGWEVVDRHFHPGAYEKSNTRYRRQKGDSVKHAAAGAVGVMVLKGLISGGSELTRSRRFGSRTRLTSPDWTSDMTAARAAYMAELDALRQAVEAVRSERKNRAKAEKQRRRSEKTQKRARKLEKKESRRRKKEDRLRNDWRR